MAKNKRKQRNKKKKSKSEQKEKEKKEEKKEKLKEQKPKEQKKPSVEISPEESRFDLSLEQVITRSEAPVLKQDITQRQPVELESGREAPSEKKEDTPLYEPLYDSDERLYSESEQNVNMRGFEQRSERRIREQVVREPDQRTRWKRIYEEKRTAEPQFIPESETTASRQIYKSREKELEITGPDVVFEQRAPEKKIRKYRKITS